MQTPEQFEQELKQRYQHDQALHPLPQHIRQSVLRQAASTQNSRSVFRWRNVQLAFSCAALALLAFLLADSSGVSAPLYYQVVVTHEAGFAETQQHSLSEQKSEDVKADRYQQYLAANKHSAALHRQVGLLQHEQQQWSITVCNDLLLTIAPELMAQLDIEKQVHRKLEQPQWVEFIRNQHGQLVAIETASTALACPHS